MTEASLDAILARILAPELGYVADRWPEVLYGLVRKWAEQTGAAERDVLADVLAKRDPERLGALVDAATVRHTSFFRHPEQFEHLRRVLPSLAPNRTLEAWCAGCASGEEAYSLALCASEAGVRARILATDVSAQAVEVARAGRYPARRTLGIPGHPPATPWTAPAALKRMIRFEVASLLGPSPAVGSGPFDLILCRNVLIYFDRQTTPEILGRLATHLRAGGALVVAPGDGTLPIPSYLVRGPAIGWLVPESLPPKTPLPARRRSAPPARLRSAPPPPAEPGVLDEAARLLGSGNHEEAERLLREALDCDIDGLAAWFLLGESLLQRGERSQAAVAFQRAGRCTVRNDEIDGEALKRAAIRRAASLVPASRKS